MPSVEELKPNLYKITHIMKSTLETDYRNREFLSFTIIYW